MDYLSVSCAPYLVLRSRGIESIGNNQLDNPAIEGFVVNSRDITERKEQKRELQRQNERLERFASVVSHDLRNPLSVARVRMDLAQDAHDSEHLDPIEQAHERMEQLIDQVLTLAREGKPVSDTEQISLPVTARRSWQTVATAEATLSIETDRTIRANRSRLQQLLENLSRNAVEHGGEDVRITVGELHGEAGFAVADSGPGIPEDERDNAFEPGYSTSENGTGFGLTIVDKAVYGPPDGSHSVTPQRVRVKILRRVLEISMTSGSRPTVLLTNDDGIEAVGLQTLYERLSEFADVTAVAPRENHSGMGRVLSFGRPVPLRVGTETDSIEFEESQLGHQIQFESHDLGYAVEGTPCDCVIAGVTELTEPDIVVSGCNPGANIGVNAFGRSGTVAAAIEAAYFGVPAIALSSEKREPARSTYSQIGEFAKRLVRFTLSNGVFDRVDYLNVASPAGTNPPVEVTRPASEYQFTASADESEGVLRFTHSRQPERVTGVDHGGENQTDREALKQGKVSITPLRFPFEPTDSPDLRNFVDATQ